MSKLEQLEILGQSIWVDYIHHSFVTSGQLAELINLGVRGLTSNPTIFEKAIVGSDDYDQTLTKLFEKNLSTEEIYEMLILDDIRKAADILLPVYEQSNGKDGFVSIEVNPKLAYDTRGSISEAIRLYNKLDRTNIMIKIPANEAGVKAIKSLISLGINVNATLIFSLQHYQNVAQAYISGLEKRAAAGEDISKIASVASFFVSRVDTVVDRQLHKIGDTTLQGKVAIANATIAYASFQEIFSNVRWKKLAALGAKVQRPLWASTSTKNPAYPDTLYIDNLIGENTVNTIPLETLSAYLDHGQILATLQTDIEKARMQLSSLEQLGINLNDITQKLQQDGITAFSNSFESLINSITQKHQSMEKKSSAYSLELFQYQSKIDQAIEEIRDNQIIARIWAHDHTVWNPEPEEILNRLGWLKIAENMEAEIPELESFVKDIKSAGYQCAVLLGMGGSSLAPEVLRNTFGVKDYFLDLKILDSTDPDTISSLQEILDISRTIFIVATKSGGTVETLSLFKYFYNQVVSTIGKEQAGSHFIAITDPGSRLVELAKKYHFHKIFLNDPNIGGRYSALSYFGLVPAALIGVDLEKFLEIALKTSKDCEASDAPEMKEKLCVLLGVVMGEMAKAGRDKLTLVLSSEIRSFGDWVEQLIAESTGKQGKGILPVVEEKIGKPESYDQDRLFIYFRLAGDHRYDHAIQELKLSGQPVLQLNLIDTFDLSRQFFIWEFATAIAGYRLGIQPFDQPNVETAKVMAREMVAEYQKTGILPDFTPIQVAKNIQALGDIKEKNLPELLTNFLSLAKPGAYISLQAYVKPSSAMDASLLELQTCLRNRTKLAVTVGYGPRFLHSTGQLHKGDAGNGLFIQFISIPPNDLSIPDEAGSDETSISFGVLKLAQALGDRQALLDAGRKVISFLIEEDIPTGIMQIVHSL